MALIDKKDLDIDPGDYDRSSMIVACLLTYTCVTVVRFQHKHYVPLTLFLGIALPTLIGASYGDAMGGFVWGGIVSTIFIWHFTFFIVRLSFSLPEAVADHDHDEQNSLAHYVGEQSYSEDLSARGNFVCSSFLVPGETADATPAASRCVHWW